MLEKSIDWQEELLNEIEDIGGDFASTTRLRYHLCL